MRPDRNSDSAVDAAGPITVTAKPRGYGGYVDGLRQPALQLQLRVAAFDMARWLALDTALCATLPLPDGATPTPDVAAVVARISQWVAALERKAGMPVFEAGRKLRVSASDPGCYALLQPCLDPRACLDVFKFIIGIANQALSSDGATGPVTPAAPDDIAAMVTRIGALAPRGFNSIHFLQAAHELGVPWTRIIDNVFQFGWGARSHWLSSSFTENTSNIATKLARDKLLCAAVLRDSGIPVPRHLVVQSADDAVRGASAIGYPVVVKPANLDGGRGVAANLKTATAVRKAFNDAHALSQRVLVEKHIAGRDFRLHVVRGQVLGVLERVPGGVVGNGVDAVRALLAQQNLERRVADDDRRYLKEMALDAEALEQLAECGMHADSVPAAQQLVRLRGAANVASGGVPLPLPLDAVHPDNLQLAVRAVDALRLDVAGVDLLMPDITQSWREVGGAICEVNAQPQMFSTMHAPMLQKLIGPSLGRIPTVVVLGDAAAHALGRCLQQALTAKGGHVGWVGADEVGIDEHCIHIGRVSAQRGGNMLLRDRSVQALVLAIDDERSLEHGWPIDRCNVLVITAPAATGHAGAAPAAALVAFASALRPARVIVEARATYLVALARATFGERRLDVVEPTGDAQALPWQALTDATLRALGLGSATSVL